jgi:hypothetical protein
MRRESSTAKSMCQSFTQFKERSCKIQGSHSGVAKVSSLLGCYTATTGIWLPTIQMTVVPSGSRTEIRE